ncbi:MAG: hypothetical protein R3B90_21685 [Planctomycetaceae bacterium]
MPNNCTGTITWTFSYLADGSGFIDAGTYVYVVASGTCSPECGV